MKDLPASHPLYGSEQSKSGFGICYQFAIKCPVSALRPQCFQGFAGFVSYSHSIITLRYGDEVELPETVTAWQGDLRTITLNFLDEACTQPYEYPGDGTDYTIYVREEAE